MNNYQHKYKQSKILKFETELNCILETPQIKAPKEVHVFVTSKKELKLNAAKKIVENNPRFSESKLIVTGFKSSSNIAEQPISMESGELGATNRIHTTKKLQSFKEYLKEKNPTSYIFVSIENYFTEPKNGSLFDHAMVIVENEFQNIFKYVSDGVEMNSEFYDDALKKGGKNSDGTGLNITLGDIFHSKYPEIPSSDWHGHVTKSETFSGLTRTEQIMSSINNKKLF
eukprot:gene5505-9322_t